MTGTLINCLLCCSEFPDAKRLNFFPFRNKRNIQSISRRILQSIHSIFGLGINDLNIPSPANILPSENVRLCLKCGPLYQKMYDSIENIKSLSHPDSPLWNSITRKRSQPSNGQTNVAKEPENVPKPSEDEPEVPMKRHCLRDGDRQQDDINSVYIKQEIFNFINENDDAGEMNDPLAQFQMESARDKESQENDTFVSANPSELNHNSFEEIEKKYDPPDPCNNTAVEKEKTETNVQYLYPHVKIEWENTPVDSGVSSVGASKENTLNSETCSPTEVEFQTPEFDNGVDDYPDPGDRLFGPFSVSTWLKVNPSIIKNSYQCYICGMRIELSLSVQ